MSFLEEIKAIPIIDYAARCGYTVVKKGKYYSLKEHDSVIIDPAKNCYWRNSVFQIGAKNNRRGAAGSIIDFAIEFMGYDDAKKTMRELAVVYNISEKNSSYKAAETTKIKKTTLEHRTLQEKELCLPAAAEDCKRVYRYLLSERKIDVSVIRYFIAKKMLYQDATHGNCVFHTDKFACIRSTGEKRFVMDLEGSNYEECFFFRPSSAATTLVVAESVIDIMSIMTQFVREKKRYTNYCYLALAGTNKISSLFYHLRKEKDIQRVLLAFDNDDAGMIAQASAIEELKAILYEGTVEIYTAPFEKDWNAYIQATS